MFLLPFFGDFLLVDHDFVRLFFITFVAFLRFEKTVLEVGNLDIAFVVELVDAPLEHDLETVDLRQRALFLVSELVNELAEPLVIVEVALIVTHVRV